MDKKSSSSLSLLTMMSAGFGTIVTTIFASALSNMASETTLHSLTTSSNPPITKDDDHGDYSDK